MPRREIKFDFDSYVLRSTIDALGHVLGRPSVLDRNGIGPPAVKMFLDDLIDQALRIPIEEWTIDPPSAEKVEIWKSWRQSKKIRRSVKKKRKLI